MTNGFATVSAIANAVRNGAVTAVSVVEEHLERIEESQPGINAFTLIQRESALRAAAAIDAAVAAGEPVGPLAGVPIALKDLIDHAGFPNTAGSNFPTVIPAASATIVDRLQQAGAIVIGRTGLHEYAFGFSSENHWFGPVRNPWNPALSPGGSSGGSAAAVAIGAAPAAIGTDTGGSVRVPAALCGVVGLKVTHGRVPLNGVYPLAPSLDTVGPLARNCNDAALVYEAIAGYDSSDPWSKRRTVTSPDHLDSLAGVTFGVPHPWVDLPQTETVAAAFSGLRAELATAGATLIDLDLPALQPAPEIEHIAYAEVAQVHKERWLSRPDTYGPEVAARVEAAVETDPALYVTAQRWRAEVSNTAEAALADCDFLVTPAVAAAAKPIGEDEIEVGGKTVPYRPQLSRYSALVNQTGLPAIALPLDMGGNPPPSAQFVGRRWQEHRLLELGDLLERAGISRYRKPPTSAIY